MKILKILFALVVLVVVSLGVAFYFFSDSIFVIAKPALEKMLEKAVQSPVTIQKVNVSLFPQPRLLVDNLIFATKECERIEVETLAVSLKIIPLLKGELLFNTITLDRPSLSCTRESMKRAFHSGAIGRPEILLASDVSVPVSTGYTDLLFERVQVKQGTATMLLGGKNISLRSIDLTAGLRSDAGIFTASDLVLSLLSPLGDLIKVTAEEASFEQNTKAAFLKGAKLEGVGATLSMQAALSPDRKYVLTILSGDVNQKLLAKISYLLVQHGVSLTAGTLQIGKGEIRGDLDGALPVGSLQFNVRGLGGSYRQVPFKKLQADMSVAMTGAKTDILFKNATALVGDTNSKVDASGNYQLMTNNGEVTFAIGETNLATLKNLIPATVALSGSASASGTVQLRQGQASGSIKSILNNIDAKYESYQVKSLQGEVNAAVVGSVLQSINSPRLSGVFGTKLDSLIVAGDYDLTTGALKAAFIDGKLHAETIEELLPPEYQKAFIQYGLKGMITPRGTIARTGQTLTGEGTVILADVAAQLFGKSFDRTNGTLAIAGTGSSISLSADNLVTFVRGEQIALPIVLTYHNNGSLRLKLSQSPFGVGQVAANIAVSDNDAIAGNLKVQSLPLQKLAIFTESQTPLSGQLNELTADISQASFTPSLSVDGSVSTRLTEVVLEGVNLAQKVLDSLEAIPLLGDVAMAKRSPRFDKFFSAQDTVLHLVQGQGEAVGSAIDWARFVVNSDLFRLNLKGLTAFDQRLNLAGTITFSSDLSQEFITSVKELAKFRNAQGELVLPIAIKGTIHAPRVEPDLSQLLQGTAQSIIEDGANRFLEKLLKSKQQ